MLQRLRQEIEEVTAQQNQHERVSKVRGLLLWRLKRCLCGVYPVSLAGCWKVFKFWKMLYKVLKVYESRCSAWKCVLTTSVLLWIWKQLSVDRSWNSVSSKVCESCSCSYCHVTEWSQDQWKVIICLIVWSPVWCVHLSSVFTCLMCSFIQVCLPVQYDHLSIVVMSNMFSHHSQQWMKGSVLVAVWSHEQSLTVVCWFSYTQLTVVSFWETVVSSLMTSSFSDCKHLW